MEPKHKEIQAIVGECSKKSNKIVPELKELSYQERLKALNVPTLYYRRMSYDLIQLYEIISNIEDTNIDKFVLSLNDNNTRGHIFKLQKPRCSKSFRQQTFLIRCIGDWNALPENIVESETVLKFKTELDKKWGGGNLLWTLCTNKTRRRRPDV